MRNDGTTTRSITLVVALGVSSLATLPAIGQVTFEDRAIYASNASTSDFFGHAVAVTGSIAVISAYNQGPGGGAPGAVYVIDAISGHEHRMMQPNDIAASDQFGWSVAVSGTTAIVGSRADDDDGTNTGSAYLMDITTGQVIHKLHASTPATFQEFGYAVAISGPRALVGTPKAGTSGTAYVFDTATGQGLFDLTPSDGDGGDKFGQAVAMSGNLAVITSNGQFENDNSVGAAYVFDMTTGQELFKLTADDGAFADNMGLSVSVSGNLAIIGAHGDDDNGSNSGSAYIFDITTGQQLHKLTPDDGAADDEFGRAVAISGNLAVVAAHKDDDRGSNSGSAYVFDATTGQQLIKLAASDGDSNDDMGRSVAITGNLAVTGASNADRFGSGSGAAYAYNIKEKAGCPADLTGDGILDFFDISAFLAAFSASDPVADFSEDGVFDFFDISAFLSAFTKGCP